MPVTNRYGQVMLAARIELTERHKRTLVLWGISTVTITESDEDEEEASDEITAELRMMLAERLSKKIKWKPRNALEQNLVQMIINHLIIVCKRELKKR
jgi:hypothetical protein